MRSARRSSIAWPLVLIALLTSCGGGSDDSPGQSHSGQALLGPLAGAAVEVYAVSHLDGAPLYTTTTANGDLDQAGRFLLPERILADDQLYLVKISGGDDIDADDDGVIDAAPTPNQGSIHAVLTTEQIRAGAFHVSILTEALYWRVRYLLGAGYDRDAILKQLDTRAAVALSADVDGDGDRDLDDAIHWHPRRHQSALRHAYSRYRALTERVHQNQALGADIFRPTGAVLGEFEFSGDDYEVSADGKTVSVFIRDRFFNHDRVVLFDISQPETPQIAAEITLESLAYAVTLQDDLLFVQYDRSVAIYDISDPRTPRYTGNFSTDVDVAEVAMRDGIAYVRGSARDEPQVEIFNLEDLQAPIRISVLALRDVYPTAGKTKSMRLHDGFLYLATVSGEMLILDVSNPQVLTFTTSFPLSFQGQWVFDDHFVYAIDQTDTFRVVDVTDPALPHAAGTLPLSSGAKILGRQGKTLYVGESGGTNLYTIDISDPAAPRLGPHLPSGGPLNYAAFSDRQAVFGDYAGHRWITDLEAMHLLETGERFQPMDMGATITSLSAQNGIVSAASSRAPLDRRLHLFENASVPGTLRALGDVPLGVWGGDIVHDEDRIYTGYDGGFEVIDTSAPNTPRFLGAIDARWYMNVVVRETTAYISSMTAGLRIFDVSDPAQPELLGRELFPDIGRSIALSEDGRVAYSTNGLSELYVIDVRKPREPTLIATVDIRDEAAGFLNWNGLVVNGQRLYLLFDQRLKVFDISDAQQPVLLNQALSGDFGTFVGADATRLYIASSQGLDVVDISSNSGPQALASIPMNGLRIIAAKDGFAYAGEGSFSSARVHVVDIGDPNNPLSIGSVEVGKVSFSSFPGIADKGALYVLDAFHNQIVMIDVSDPATPQLLKILELPAISWAWAEQIAIEGTSAYFVGTFIGLQIADVSVPSQATLEGAFGNFGFLTGFRVQNGLAYVCDEYIGFSVFDVRDARRVRERGRLDPRIYCTQVMVNGAIAYTFSPDFIEDETTKLRAVDVRDGANPHVIGELDLALVIEAGFFRNSIQKAGDNLVIIGTDADGTPRLQLVDVTDPTTPALRGSVTLLGQSDHVSVMGHIAYVSSARGVQLIDIADPAQPRWAGVINEPSFAVAADNGFVFFTDGAAIKSARGITRAIP